MKGLVGGPPLVGGLGPGPPGPPLKSGPVLGDRVSGYEICSSDTHDNNKNHQFSDGVKDTDGKAKAKAKDLKSIIEDIRGQGHVLEDSITDHHHHIMDRSSVSVCLSVIPSGAFYAARL